MLVRLLSSRQYQLFLNLQKGNCMLKSQQIFVKKIVVVVVVVVVSLFAIAVVFVGNPTTKYTDGRTDRRCNVESLS